MSLWESDLRARETTMVSSISIGEDVLTQDQLMVTRGGGLAKQR
jgi:hypothetical protein